MVLVAKGGSQSEGTIRIGEESATLEQVWEAGGGMLRWV